MPSMSQINTAEDHVERTLIREALRLRREAVKAEQERDEALMRAQVMEESISDLIARQMQVEAKLDEVNPDWKASPGLHAAWESLRGVADGRTR